MPDLQKITDWRDRVFNRLLSQFKEGDNWGLLFDAIGGSLQENEDAIWEVWSQRRLDSAVGAQLDLWGAVVNRERDGASDDRYRARIKAELRILRSNGTPDELLEILAALADVPIADTTYSDCFPAAFGMSYVGTAYSTDPAWGIDIAEGINRARPVAVGICQIIEEHPDSFKFDTSGQGFDEGEFSVDLAAEAGV